MNHKLSVTVQVDLDGEYVRVLATGCLTEASQRALHPLIRRARILTPGIHVTVDLSGAHHIEATGMELLRRALEDTDSAGSRPVALVVPDVLPHHRITVSPESRVTPDSSAGTGPARKVAA
ncbi:hypothetical protein [Kocuria turfanensis]|uniref:STAS domain-containing protein n=1 Tax=Kocuria turfanensis TaxID=388357 RepID=A0A512IHT5_9MICC|nr:hypothetical protein [Kocuria turfanensis]GEO97250.1 hypothetical protein KTU01_33730 [Kocuria turfanensis]